MSEEFPCRKRGCDGMVRRARSGGTARCPECGRVYAPAQGQKADGPAREPGPSPSGRLPKSNGPARSDDEPVRKKRKKRGSSGGLLAGLGGVLSGNAGFVLTRLLPAVLIVGGVFGTIIYYGVKSRSAARADKLANLLFDDVRGASVLPHPSPYVRGELAILETQAGVDGPLQDSSKPLHWLHDGYEPPRDPKVIGSVILIEWRVTPVAARNKSGQAMGVREPGKPGGSDDPVMLKLWGCDIKLIDRKTRLGVYSVTLHPPDRTFEEGQRVLTTPSSSVPPELLAAEIDKIRAFRKVALDQDVPVPSVQPPSPPPKLPGWGKWVSSPNQTGFVALPKLSAERTETLECVAPVVESIRLYATVSLPDLSQPVRVSLTESRYDAAAAGRSSIQQILDAEVALERQACSASFLNLRDHRKPSSRVGVLTAADYMGTSTANERIRTRILVTEDRTRCYRVTAVFPLGRTEVDTPVEELVTSFHVPPPAR